MASAAAVQSPHNPVKGIELTSEKVVGAANTNGLYRNRYNLRSSLPAKAPIPASAANRSTPAGLLSQPDSFKRAAPPETAVPTLPKTTLPARGLVVEKVAAFSKSSSSTSPKHPAVVSTPIQRSISKYPSAQKQTQALAPKNASTELQSLRQTVQEQQAKLQRCQKALWRLQPSVVGLAVVVQNQQKQIEALKELNADQARDFKLEIEDNKRSSKKDELTHFHSPAKFEPAESLLSEVDSLQVVLSMRNQEIRDLRKQLLQLKLKEEELYRLEKEHQLALQCTEELRSALSRRAEQESQQDHRIQRLVEDLERERRKSVRLSMSNDELLFKLTTCEVPTYASSCEGGR